MNSNRRISQDLYVATTEASRMRARMMETGLLHLHLHDQIFGLATMFIRLLWFAA